MTDIKLIRVPAILTRVSPRKDGGFSLGFVTNEVIDPDERANILNMYNKFGWLIHADHQVNEIPREVPDRGAGAKTQSERIRAVLFRLYEYKKPKETFEEYYNHVTEAFINRLKEDLPNETPTQP